MRLFRQHKPFRLVNDQITVLESPQEYLSRLRSLIDGARKRVALSALYLGGDSLSRSLISTVESRLKQPHAPAVSFLFDYGRATRKEKHGSSVAVCSDAVALGAKLFLFCTPNTPLIRSALPERLSEVLGVQHAKVQVIDDSVIISGANLSQSYFEDRKDRYMLIQDAEVADFYHRLLGVVQSGSYMIGPDGALTESTLLGDPQKQGAVFARNFKGAVYSLLQERLNLSYADHVSRCTLQELNQEGAIWLLPTLQMGVCDVRVDENMTAQMLQELSASQECEVVVASGYFNLTHKFQRLFHATKNTTIVVASPQANAWWNSSGRYSRFVPAAYSHLQAKFLARNVQGSGSCRVREWQRGHWSFHTKGMWFLFDGHPSAGTVIGSANFGRRSAEYDLEAQALLWAPNCASFAAKMKHEVNMLLADCSPPVTLQQMRNDEHRKMPWFLKAAMPAFSRWM